MLATTVTALTLLSTSMTTQLHALHPHLHLRRSAAPRLAEAVVPDQAANAMQPTFTPMRLSHLADYADGTLSPMRLRTADGKWCYALANEETAVRLASAGIMQRTRVGFYFALWYALSIIYSVKNKQAHMALALPNIIATAQLLVGGLVAAFVWKSGLRTPPEVSGAALRTLMPIGLMHGIGHLTGVYATAAGSVSFVQVVKSAGPFWASLLSVTLLRQTVSRRVWLSLMPVVGGVALASAQELSFVWSAFLASVASDIALALRNVLSKKSMDRPQAGNMTPANTFYLFTCLSCLFCLPLSLGLEWRGAAVAWAAAVPSTGAAVALLSLIVQSGLYFTAYSEVQFKALDQISPVTHAVGNTMRRVVIMLVCVAVFGTPVTLLGGVGSAIAIAGSYAYAMAKTYEAEAAKKKTESEATAASTAATQRAEEAMQGQAVEHPLLPLLKAVGKVVRMVRA